MGQRKTVTIKDIAKRVGLSHPAVSKALTGSKHGTASVSPATRERVRAVAREMGYRPSSIARALRSGRSGLLGIIHHQTVDQIATRRLFGVLNAIQPTDFRPHVHYLDTRFDEKAEEAAGAMLDARVEGVVCIMPPAAMGQKQFDSLLNAGIPVAVIGGCRARGVSVYHDDRRRAYREIFEHLVGLGARNIAMLFGRSSGGSGWVTDHFLDTVFDSYSANGKALSFDDCVDGTPYRLKTDRQSLTVRRFSVTPEEVEDGIREFPDVFPLFIQGYLCMQRLIETGKLPDAVMCQIDGSAFGAMRACSEHGIAVPEDFAMAGFGNEAPASGGLAPLTTADHPIDELCQLAVQDLSKRIASGQAISPRKSPVLRPSKLIPRYSTTYLLKKKLR